MIKVLLTTLVLTIICCGCSHNVNNAITISTVESDIRAHLPIGSPKIDVIAFLDQRKIRHAWLQKAEGASNGTTAFPNSHTEIGYIPNVRKDGLIFKTYVSIQINFKFDDADSKLVSYTVQEVYKGL
jgi:hypothetical protein